MRTAILFEIVIKRTNAFVKMIKFCDKIGRRFRLNVCRIFLASIFGADVRLHDGKNENVTIKSFLSILFPLQRNFQQSNSNSIWANKSDFPWNWCVQCFSIQSGTVKEKWHCCKLQVREISIFIVKLRKTLARERLKLRGYQ